MTEQTDQPKVDVVLGLPLFDGKPEYETSKTIEFTMYALQDEGLRPHRTIAVGSLLPKMRQEIAESAVELGAKWLFFIDGDMKFPGQLVLRLMAHDLDIVSGLYVKKAAPYLPAASIWSDEDKDYHPLQVVPEDALCEVDAVGTGCLLIKTEVFAKIPKPWFLFWDAAGDGRIHGEDYYFCHKAIEAGFKVHLDTGASCYHIGRYGYSIKDRKVWLAAQAAHERKMEQIGKELRTK